MSRKQKLSKVERERRRERKAEQEMLETVRHTTKQLTCSAETAREVISECDTRLMDADIALVFANLAHEVWAARPGPAEKLGALLAELREELNRHAQAVHALALRFLPIASGNHEHLDLDAVDPEEVLRATFPPRENLRAPIESQIPTDSEGH